MYNYWDNNISRGKEKFKFGIQNILNGNTQNDLNLKNKM